jgi:hypothetical protein
MAEPAVVVKLARTVVHPEQAPKVFHKVLWARVGADFVLELGQADIQELRDALDAARATKANETQVKLWVTDRFTITPTTLLDLIRSTNEMARDMVKEKYLDQKSVVAAIEGKDG